MEHKIVVYEMDRNGQGQLESEREVYSQTVSDLNIPALVELVNNGRRRTRTRSEKTIKEGAQ